VTPPLADLFKIRPRFHRSVDLVRDLETADGLDGYILTAQGAELAATIRRGLGAGSTERALTLTGPYGVGKSAFALFLAALLSPKQLPTRRLALAALGRAGLPALASQLATGLRSSPGYLVIPVSGTRDSLCRAVAEATAVAIRRQFGANRKPWKTLYDQLHLLTDRRKRPKAAEEDYFAILAKLQEAVLADGLEGIVMIVDELGKFLEHAAASPVDDVFLLQRLAEHASRSGKQPFAILTILHQAFERYAVGLPQTARDEWQKIQGRFRDVAFIEQPAELLQLVGSAIERRGTWPREVEQRYAAAIDGGMFAGVVATETRDLYTRTLPLHPVTGCSTARALSECTRSERTLTLQLPDLATSTRVRRVPG
jgi:hypothetical protein